MYMQSPLCELSAATLAAEAGLGCMCPQTQMHSFNCPFQLASAELWPQADSADDADVYEVDLQPGDVIIMGSDGLFDNMWDSELEKIVAAHLKVSCVRKICPACMAASALLQLSIRLSCSTGTSAGSAGRGCQHVCRSY